MADNRSRVVLGTARNRWQAFRSTFATDSSFPSKVPTTTEPTGEGVIDLNSDQLGNSLLIALVGTDAADETFNMLLLGWEQIGTLWVPVPLLQAAATLGTTVGVAGTTLTASHYFADTITLSKIASSGVDAWAKSPADNRVATILADGLGFAKIEAIFDRNSSAASCNALLKVI